MLRLSRDLTNKQTTFVGDSSDFPLQRLPESDSYVSWLSASTTAVFLLQTLAAFPWWPPTVGWTLAPWVEHSDTKDGPSTTAVLAAPLLLLLLRLPLLLLLCARLAVLSVWVLVQVMTVIMT